MMKLTKDQEQEVILLTQGIVRQPGVSGEEAASAKILARKMKQLEYDEVKIDAYGDVIGVIYGAKPGPTLLFDGHIDVVPIRESNAWEYEPYGAELKDGIIWGRGASDMKGPVAAMVCAASYVNRQDISGTIVISCSVAEECLMGQALSYILKNYTADAVLITEGTNLKLGISEKGRACVEMVTTGKVVHDSRPELGDNAVYRMMEAVSRIRSIPLRQDPDMGTEVIELSDIISSPYPGNGFVPGSCRTSWVCRLLAGETKESFYHRWMEALKGMDKVRVNYAILSKKCYTGVELKKFDFFPAWISENNTPFRKQVEKAILDSGVDLEHYSVPYGTNGDLSGGLMGIPTLVLGPGDIYSCLIHQPNEHIYVKDLLKAVEIYCRVIELNGNFSS